MTEEIKMDAPSFIYPESDLILLPSYEAFCNSAKGLMSGEFKITGPEHECPECEGEGLGPACPHSQGESTCEVCNGTGTLTDEIVVPWTTIKDIYKVIVSDLGKLPECAEDTRRLEWFVENCAIATSRWNDTTKHVEWCARDEKWESSLRSAIDAAMKEDGQ